MLDRDEDNDDVYPAHLSKLSEYLDDYFSTLELELECRLYLEQDIVYSWSTSKPSIGITKNDGYEYDPRQFLLPPETRLARRATVASTSKQKAKPRDTKTLKVSTKKEMEDTDDDDPEWLNLRDHVSPGRTSPQFRFPLAPRISGETRPMTTHHRMITTRAPELPLGLSTKHFAALRSTSDRFGPLHWQSPAMQDFTPPKHRGMMIPREEQDNRSRCCSRVSRCASASAGDRSSHKSRVGISFTTYVLLSVIIIQKIIIQKIIREITRVVTCDLNPKRVSRVDLPVRYMPTIDPCHHVDLLRASLDPNRSFESQSH